MSHLLFYFYVSFAAGMASGRPADTKFLEYWFGPSPAIQLTGWIAVLVGLIVSGGLLLGGSGQMLAWVVGVASLTLGMFEASVGLGFGYVASCLRAMVEIAAGALQFARSLHRSGKTMMDE